MTDIKKSREKIDAIDEKITELFKERMTLAKEIADYKTKNRLPTLNRDREKEVIRKNADRISDEKLKPYLEKFYEELMSISRNYQDSLRKKEAVIGYYGVEGSFSHEACLKYISSVNDNNIYKAEAYDTFDNLCMALLNDETDYAVIPLENSSTGPVIDVYDLLLKYDFNIVGEVKVEVIHNLLAKDGVTIEDIKEVYSHSQAFMQCKKYLKNYNFTKIPYYNTAISAKFVSESPRNDIAAIGSDTAAKLYGLKVLEHGINYNVNNITKFIILSKNKNISEKNDKISIVISLKNQPGTLFNALKYVHDSGVNMMKIESRPDINNPFEYIFFIDFEGNINDENIKNLIENLKNISKQFKFLGNYKAL